MKIKKGNNTKQCNKKTKLHLMYFFFVLCFYSATFTHTPNEILSWKWLIDNKFSGQYKEYLIMCSLYILYTLLFMFLSCIINARLVLRQFSWQNKMSPRIIVLLHDNNFIDILRLKLQCFIGAPRQLVAVW